MTYRTLYRAQHAEWLAWLRRYRPEAVREEEARQERVEAAFDEGSVTDCADAP